jgi:hypothetical protein
VTRGFYAYDPGHGPSDWFHVRIDGATLLADGRYHVRGFWLDKTAVGWSTGDALEPWATFSPTNWKPVDGVAP